MIARAMTLDELADPAAVVDEIDAMIVAALDDREPRNVRVDHLRQLAVSIQDLIHDHCRAAAMTGREEMCHVR